MGFMQDNKKINKFYGNALNGCFSATLLKGKTRHRGKQ
jgi:hypothetical protein